MSNVPIDTRGKLPYASIFANIQIDAILNLEKQVLGTAFAADLLTGLANQTGITKEKLDPNGTQITRNAGVFGRELGEIQEFTRTQTRRVYKKYSLGKFSFEPEKVLPLGITTTLECKRVMLYGWDALKTFGFFSGSLFYQQLPFIIYQFEDAPNPVDQAHFLFTYCWFTSNPETFSLKNTNDPLMVQDCSIECGQVIVFDNSLSGVNSAIDSALAFDKTIKSSGRTLFRK